MKHFRYPLLAMLILLASMLACGQRAAQEAALPPTQVSQPTLRPTFTNTPLPQTDTPVPPTPTLVPTLTPLPPTISPAPRTDTPMPTATPIPTDTSTPTPTPAPTKKAAAPTKTPVPPTATPDPFLLRDSFSGGFGPGWKVFTNYWRVKDSQWFWSGSGGVDGSGAMEHNCCRGGDEAEDALMMYLGEGAENWTDYRVEVDLIVPTEKGQWQGLWVRGQFEEKTKKEAAQWVTGYYVLLGRNRVVKLVQLQTLEDCQGNACRNPQNLYAFNNPYILREEKIDGVELTRNAWHKLAVEVRGNSMKIWVDGVFAYEHVDNKAPFLQGTVGFKTYESEPVRYDNIVVTALD